MPRVTIEWFNTRSDQERAELAKRITEAFVAVADVKAESVSIRFDEYEPRLFAKGGVIHK